MPFVVATYVYASSQGQRTHSARTKIGSVQTIQITKQKGGQNRVGVVDYFVKDF